jgi:hypothetical protein
MSSFMTIVTRDNINVVFFAMVLPCFYKDESIRWYLVLQGNLRALQLTEILHVYRTLLSSNSERSDIQFEV